MPDFITRFMLKKPSGWKFTELCFLKDDSTFPLAFGEGDAECVSAPWDPLILAPDVLEALVFQSLSGAFD